MRMLGVLLLLIIIQLSVGIFWNNLDSNTLTINPYTGGSSTAQSEQRLWNFIFNPTLWTEDSFWLLLSTAIVIGTGITIGTIFGVRSDLTYLFGLFLFFAAFGAVPISSLYLVIYSEVGVFAGCTVGSSCLPAGIVAFFFSGVLAAVWIFTCIEWWSGRPMT